MCIDGNHSCTSNNGHDASGFNSGIGKRTISMSLFPREPYFVIVLAAVR